MQDIKAVMLVGGLGTRLRSVVPSTPKVLASIGREIVPGITGSPAALTGNSEFGDVHRLSCGSDREQIRRWPDLGRFDRVFEGGDSRSAPPAP